MHNNNRNGLPPGMNPMNQNVPLIGQQQQGIPLKLSPLQSAFPVDITVPSKVNDSGTAVIEVTRNVSGGLSKLEYAAIQIAAGIAADTEGRSTYSNERIAEVVDYAERVLAECAKRETPEAPAPTSNEKLSS